MTPFIYHHLFTPFISEDDILIGDGNGTLAADDGEDLLDGGEGNDKLWGKGQRHSGGPRWHVQVRLPAKPTVPGFYKQNSDSHQCLARAYN